MVSVKISKNNLFFVFLIFGYIFGVMLYDFIEFKYTDELMAAFLVLFTGLILWERRSWDQAKAIIYTRRHFFFFYIIYSFMIKSNVPKAILMDAVIQIKPFLGFYCTYLLMPVLSKKNKLFITIMCLSFAFILLIIALLGHIDTIFGHPFALCHSCCCNCLSISVLLFIHMERSYDFPFNIVGWNSLNSFKVLWFFYVLR